MRIIPRRRGVDPLGLPYTIHRWRASEIVAADGDPISSWNNESGGDDLVQATGAKQPRLDANGIDGGPALLFDGGDYLSANALAAIIAPGTNLEYTAFIVGAQNQAALTGSCTLLGVGNSTATSWIVTHRLVDGKASSWRQNIGTTSVARTNSEVEAAGAHVFEMFHDGAVTSMLVDGVPRQDQAQLYTPTISSSDRLSIGALVRSTEAAFFNGHIAEVILIPAALTATQRTQIRLMLAETYGITAAVIKRHAPRRVTDIGASWWSEPRAVRHDGKVYSTGATPAGGTLAVAELGGSGDRISVGAYAPDDHNTGALIHPAGKAPIFVGFDHNDSELGVFWTKGASHGDFAGLGTTRTRKDASTGSGTAYTQCWNLPGTDELTLFTRSGAGNSKWHVWRSTDYLATPFGDSVLMLDAGAGEQFYMTSRQYGDGTKVRVVMYGHPTASTLPNIYACEVDLDTGDVTTLAGTYVANIITPADLPFAPTDLTLVFDAVTAGVTTRLYDVSDTPDMEIAYATFTSDADSTYRVATIDADTLVITHRDVTNSGVTFGYTPAAHYNGGMNFPKGGAGGVVALSREDGGVWTIERHVLTSGAWGLDEVLTTAPDGHKYVRPYYPGGVDDELVFCDFDYYAPDSTGYRSYDGDMRMLPAFA